MTYQPLTFDFSDDFTTTENGVNALGYLVDPPSISATNENGDGSLVARVFAAWGQASATVFEGVIMGAWERSGEHAGSHARA